MESSNYRDIFLKHQAQTTQFPLQLDLVKAEGVYLYDRFGKSYLDMISGISVSSLGHGNEKVKEAIKKQVDEHMHMMVYGEYVLSKPALLAQSLVELLPQHLNCVYFVNSGAEATEGALKLAKRVTGRTKIVACKQAYHGSTHAAMSLNSETYYTQAYRPLLPDIYFADHDVLDSLEVIDNQTACFVVEVVASEKGYIPLSSAFLKAARKKCTDNGALLIIDEIQTGMGRTGKMFAFEHSGVEPDILLLGKALGAGMPIGAFISSYQNMQVFTDNPILGHITTFGGHPVIAAAALAGINELKSNSWINDVHVKEHLIRKLLTHPAIKSIQGTGLMLSLEFDSFDYNKKLIDYCIEDGLITDWFLFSTNRLRLAPPLIITEKEIEQACEIILNNIKKITRN